MKNANDDGSESLCERGRQSNESSVGILSDSNGKKDGSGSSSEKGKQSDDSSVGMNSNVKKDGSGSSSEKGKQSDDRSVGTNLDSVGLLSDRILNPILIMSPSKNTERKTLKDCELQLNARRIKYEHLDLFSNYHMKLHIKALYNGYRQDQADESTF